MKQYLVSAVFVLECVAVEGCRTLKLTKGYDWLKAAFIDMFLNSHEMHSFKKLGLPPQYTLSPLYRVSDYEQFSSEYFLNNLSHNLDAQVVEPGEHYCFRATFCATPTARHFFTREMTHQRELPFIGMPVYLGDINQRVGGHFHVAWASCTGGLPGCIAFTPEEFLRLQNKASTQENPAGESKQITLFFASPTRFQYGKDVVTVPDPKKIFSSIAPEWYRLFSGAVPAAHPIFKGTGAATRIKLEIETAPDVEISKDGEKIILADDRFYQTVLTGLEKNFKDTKILVDIPAGGPGQPGQIELTMNWNASRSSFVQYVQKIAENIIITDCQISDNMFSRQSFSKKGYTGLVKLNLKNLNCEDRKLFREMAGLSFFCGTGYGTASGMGQCWPLQD